MLRLITTELSDYLCLVLEYEDTQYANSVVVQQLFQFDEDPINWDEFHHAEALYGIYEKFESSDLAAQHWLTRHTPKFNELGFKVLGFSECFVNPLQL